MNLCKFTARKRKTNLIHLLTIINLNKYNAYFRVDFAPFEAFYVYLFKLNVSLEMRRTEKFVPNNFEHKSYVHNFVQ